MIKYARDMLACCSNATVFSQCRSSTKLAEITKDLYVRNVELTCELQQTERRLRGAQRQCRKLQETCQTWRNTVHRIVRPTGH